MPGAVLRVSGSKAGVTRFLETSRWKPITVFWKGKPRSEHSTRLSEINGFNCSVSDADGSRLVAQIRDANTFLKRQRSELTRLKRLNLHATLDFSVEANCEDAAKFVRFDATLLAELGKLGIDLEISVYLVERTR
jgi:hypothetical protein